MGDVLTPRPAGDTQRDSDRRGMIAYHSSADGLTYSLTQNIRHLMVTTTSAGTVVVTLPPVAESAGKWFTVVCDVRATGDVTINDYGDDADFTSRTLDAADEFCMFFSTGVRWLAIVTADQVL